VTTPRAEIEAALAADFSRANLAVYADCLMAEGDPRGELIAIGLLPPTPELERRKIALLEQLLGGDHGLLPSLGSKRSRSVTNAELRSDDLL
jgi:hypothetical protein